MHNPSGSGLSVEEIDQLAERLDALENPDALSLEGVDGLFCALVASPSTVLPSVYLPIILGGEPGDGAEFANHEDLQASMSLLAVFDAAVLPINDVSFDPQQSFSSNRPDSQSSPGVLKQ